MNYKTPGIEKGSGGPGTITDFENRTDESHVFDDFLKVGVTPGPHHHIGILDFEAVVNVALSVTESGGVILISGVAVCIPHPQQQIWTNGIGAELIDIEWRFRRMGDPSLPNEETVVGLYFGANEYIGIGWTNDVEFRAISYVGGARQFLAATGIAKDNGWHRARLILSGASATFFIDGAQVYQNLNAGIDFTLNFFLPGVNVVNALGTVDVDWVDIRQEFAAPRFP